MSSRSSRVTGGQWAAGTAPIELAGVLTGQSSATTAIITVGLSQASNTATPSTGGSILVATQALTVTSFAAVGWNCVVNILGRNVGYGTGSVNTSLLSDADLTIGAVGGTGPPTLASNIDCGVQAWVFATVTFSTSSATNSCQVTRADVIGLN